MSYWKLLATSWHADGTPCFHRPPFLNAVHDGDPLAIALLGAAIVAAFGPALYRFLHKR